MLQNIPPEITIASFAAIGVLTGYIWNDQSGKIKKIEEEQERCPLPMIKLDLVEMRTDIKWILKHMQK